MGDRAAVTFPPVLADDSEADLSFAPDWRAAIGSRMTHRIKDARTRADYDRASRLTLDSLLASRRDIYEAAARDELLRLGEEPTAEQMERLVRRAARKQAAACVDSMDWAKHQAALDDPDPQAPGRIRVVRDFAREPLLDEVSRSERNAALGGGAFPTLRGDGVNYVGLGNEDRTLDSDETIQHFALPRARAGEDGAEAGRSDYRLTYRAIGGDGAQFALVDDCSGGLWTLKWPDGHVRHRRREGGGRQAVIVQGGERFHLVGAGARALAFNRASGRIETLPVREPYAGAAQPKLDLASPKPAMMTRRGVETIPKLREARR